MAEQMIEKAISGYVALGKDLVAMLRDGILLVLAVLLIAWPQAINSILVEAGFEEGSFAGLKWKAKLAKSDDALVEAQATIADLIAQNKNLNTLLADVKIGIEDPKTRENISRLEALNTRLADSSMMVQTTVESTIANNASLVQKVQTSTGTIVTWGVVYGGDRTLKDAQYEITTIAPKLGLTNAAIYYRQNSYRSVATTTDRLAAEQLLQKAKERAKDAYLVNMASWCAQKVEKEGYFECAGR